LVRAQVTEETKVDEADARKYYESTLRTMKSYRRHILIRVKGSGAGQAGAKS